MTEEMAANPKLMKEYDMVFDSEEKVQQSLKISKNNFTLYIGVINFNDCAFTDPIKESRKETYLGLTKSIAELGILSPIHVMVTESYSSWKKEGNSDEDFEGYKYMVVDGFRRIYGGMKNGLKRCNAVIWDFDDKERGSELLTTLALVLNKAQRHSWSELWFLMQILQMQSPLTAGTLEYLLQLESGDSDKLKAIMERASDFPEPKEDLLANKKSLQQAYTMLQKLMKEQDQLYVEDNKGISEVEQAEEIIDNEDKDGLSDEEVREVLEMEGSFNGELSEDNFGGELENEEYDRQKVGERHPIPKEIKAETMMRDGYACICCGMGKDLPMLARLSILQSHHKISVANSGPDSPENIATVCMCCHTLVHVFLKNGLRFGMSKDQYDAMPEESKTQLKNIRNLAKLDWEAGLKLGKNKDKIKEENKDYYKFKMPGTDLAENKRAVSGYSKKEFEEG